MKFTKQEMKERDEKILPTSELSTDWLSSDLARGYFG